MNKKIPVLIGWLFGLCISLIAQESNLNFILSRFHNNPDKILVASHRGVHLDYPENSMPAFEEAIRLGVDILEVDLRSTKDGHLIIMHDKTVDRTTNGKGNVGDFTFEEIQKLRLVHNGQETSEKIPTFDQVLKLTKGRILVDLDYKADSIYVQKTCDAIRTAGMESQVLFFLYDYKEIPFLRKISGNVMIMPRAYEQKDMEAILKLEKVPVVHIDPSFYEDTAMKKFHSQTRIWANALGKYDKFENKNEGFSQLLKDMTSVNVIQTDYPGQLIEFLKNKELEKLKAIDVQLRKAEMIYEKASFPSCHASTLVETKDGILTAWFGGTHENHPDVCIYSSRLQKDGKWTAPVLIADGIQNDKERYPCWNPVLYKRDNGDIVLYYKVGPSPSTWWGEYKISKDEGKTWSKKTEIPRACLGPIKNKPVRLSTGKILYPTSIEIPGKWNVYLEMSGQDLEGWRKIELKNDTLNAIQPSVLFYKDGAMQILCRTKNKCIAESWSIDNGESWSPLTATGLPNNNAGTDAVTLSNGLQLLIYNPMTKGRNKLAVACSMDGRSWRKLIDLEDQEAGEFSYPAIIQDKKGTVHAVYTYNRKMIKYVELEIK